MARSEIPSPEKNIWGTLEDLLLASAVERHSTQNWDSVAVELQQRTPGTANLYTAELCRDRYACLELNFGSVGGAGVSNPLLDELRKLRVAELRREVELRDASIGSLKVTLKRLQEERERSLSAAPQETKDGDSVADWSCKESNSTEPKESVVKPVGEVEKPAEPPAERTVSAAPADKANGEISCNGSSGSFAKDDGAPAESKGDDGGEKEGSEVHSSSASLTRRRRTRRQKVVSGNGGVVAGDSQPLFSILEIIRSNKYGHVFERRRKSQESEKYKKLIRQHVDLQTVRLNLARGKYTSAEFFRDLLLLCSNAYVFYPRNSHESIAALQLRKLVSDQIFVVHQFYKPPIKSEPLAAWKKRSVSAIPEVKSEPSDFEESPSDEDNVVLAKKIATKGLRSSKNRSSNISKVLKPEKSTKIVGSNGRNVPTTSSKRGAASSLSRMKGKKSETKERGMVGEQKKTSKDGGGEGKRAAEASRSSKKNAGVPKKGPAVTASSKVGKRGRVAPLATRKRARK